MKNINQTDALNKVIEVLQKKKEIEFLLLKEQFQITYESLKPINLIKSTLADVASSPELKNNVLNNVIGLTTGYISKKVLLGSSRNPIKILLGSLFQFAIAKVVSKHTEGIKTTGENILFNILSFKKNSNQNFTQNENQ